MSDRGFAVHTVELSRRIVRLAIFASLFAPLSVAAQQPPEATPVTVWGPNGTVHTLARSGDALFVGGEFDYVGPATGKFATIAASDASQFNTAYSVLDTVSLVVSDGAGGWFAVPGSAPSPPILHILPDGSRDHAWVSPVFGGFSSVTLAVGNGRVFLAGSFVSVNGVPRAGIAALSASTGEVLPWNPQVAGLPPPALPGQSVSVGSLSLSQGVLYFSGAFTSVGGAARLGLAAVDAQTAAVLPFSVVSPPPAYSGFGIAAFDSRVYVGGTCGGTARSICAYDTAGAPLPTWTPPTDVTGNMLPTSGAVYAVEGSIRVIALHPNTGAKLAFASPQLLNHGGPGIPYSLAVDEGRVYIAGTFDQVNGGSRFNLAAVDAASGVLIDWNPPVGDLPYSVAAAGGRVAIGGVFKSVGGVRRRNLVSIDLRTGRPISPAMEAPHTVDALAVVGDVLVAGGALVNGTISTPTLTAYSISAGAPFAWSPATDGPIRALAASARYLFVGGGFQHFAGIASSGLVAVDLTTAQPVSWTQDRVLGPTSLSVLAGTLYVGGFAPAIPSSTPTAVAFDGTTLQQLPFIATPPMASPRGFAQGPAGVLVTGIRDFSTGSAWYDRNAGFALVFGEPLTFHVSGTSQYRDTIVAVGNVPIPQRIVVGAAGIDANTGRVVPWNLGLSGSGGAFPRAVLAGPDYVIVGGRFGAAGSVAVSNLAVFRAARTGAPQGLTSRVTDNTVTLGWRPGLDPAPESFIVEAGTAPGASDIGRFAVGSATSVTGTLGAGTYFARVRGVSASGEGPASSEVILSLPAVAAPPGTPGALTSAVNGTVVTLGWAAAPGNPTSYVLDVGTQSGLSNIGSLPTGHLDTTFATPTPAGTYFVRVRAVNSFGSSAATNEVTVVVP